MAITAEIHVVFEKPSKTVSESALVAFASLVQSDSQVREKVRQAKSPQHVVDLAREQGHEFTQATMMKMQAEKMKHLHDDHLNDATSWGDALLLCFGGHS